MALLFFRTIGQVHNLITKILLESSMLQRQIQLHEMMVFASLVAPLGRFLPKLGPIMKIDRPPFLFCSLFEAIDRFEFFYKLRKFQCEYIQHLMQILEVIGQLRSHLIHIKATV